MSEMGWWLVFLAKPGPQGKSLCVTQDQCAWLARYLSWTVTGVETYATRLGFFVSRWP